MHRFMIRKSSHYILNSSCELKEQNLDSVLSNKKTLISLYDRGRNDNAVHRLIYKGATRLSQILSQV